MATYTFKHEWVALSKMKAHPKVQRAFREPWAEEIRDHFNPDLFGELYLISNPRKPGHYLVFEGQHRLWAALQALGEDQKVYCRIYKERPLEELAAITRGVSNTKAWTHLDLFFLRVIEKEEQALRIQAVVQKYGLKFGKASRQGYVRATATCDWIVEKAGGLEALNRVVSLLHGAWHDDPDAYDKTLLRGTALICNRYEDALDDHTFIFRLKKTIGPATLLRRARDYGSAAGVSVSRAVVEILVNEYNKGLRTKRLADWK